MKSDSFNQTPRLIILLVTGMMIINFLYLYAQDTADANQKIKNSVVWNIQAQNMAADFKLNADNAQKLSEVYAKFREQNRNDLKTLPESDPEEVHESKVDSINAIARSNFKSKIESFLTKDQTEKGMVLLGSLNSRWDGYLKIILSLNIEDVKLIDKAQLDIFNYASQYLAARKAAADSSERFSGRESSRLKSELDNALSLILTKEQFENWEKKTARKKKGDN